MRDVFGAVLSPGDWVAFGARAGNTGRLGIGVVQKVQAKSVQVISIVSEWPRYEAVANERMGTLSNPERIVRLGVDAIPAEYKNAYAVEVARRAAAAQF